MYRNNPFIRYKMRGQIMRESITALINSDITAYRISKDTGIAVSVIQKILDGTSNLDNISLKNAEILATYWEESKHSQANDELNN